MNEWQLKVPHRDLDEPLDAKSIWELPDALDDPEDRQVCRALLASCHRVGMKTVGHVIWGLEALTTGERRQLLDGLRKHAGFKPASQIDHERHFEFVNTATRRKAAAETRPLRLAFSPSGAIIDLNERDDDAAREREDEKRRKAEREARAAERAVEAESARIHREAREAEVRNRLPPGVGS
jgi:hypothetical protein